MDSVDSIHSSVSSLRMEDPSIFSRDKEDSSELLRAIDERLEDVSEMLHPENTGLIEATPPNDSLASGGLAVVIGHTVARQGSRGTVPPFPRDDPTTRVTECHEYAWNTDLALRIKKFATENGIRCEIFTRDGGGVPGAYANVRQWGPTATVELHFNAANSNAKGSLALYGGTQSREWTQALQDAMVALYNRQGRLEDRGIHIPSRENGYERGRESVTQLHPSALIEPFFGDNPNDARLGIEKKQALAEAVVATYAKFARTALTTPPTPAPLPPPSFSLAGIPDVPLFRELWSTYQQMDVPVPGLDSGVANALKTVTLAQWVEESGWARSGLAEKHRNFAGMKAIAEVDRILRDIPAERVRYDAHDGRGIYLRFGNVRDFIRGYWMFMERSPYRGWRDMASRSPHDFMRFIGRIWAQKPGYADRVFVIEQTLINAGIGNADGTLRPVTSSAPSPTPGTDTEPLQPAPGSSAPTSTEVNLNALDADATATFRQLVGEFKPPHAELSALKAVLAAQWALETDWGRSALAGQHFNFAGIPWQDQLNDIAAKVPHPTAPEKGDFCRFLSLATFVKGYALRLERDAAFSGWRNHTGNPESFITFLAQRWRPEDSGYLGKWARIHEKLAKQPIGGPIGGQPPAPQPQPGSQPQPRPTSGTGFVLRLERFRQERRRGAGHARTVSRYQAIFDGQPIPELSGFIFERQGPGDNSATGVARHARIREGIYPLFTHHGSARIGRITKFKTHGFTNDTGVRKPPMPSLRLGNTSSRSGVLLHPGNNYLWSIGCLNPSKPLEGVNGNMVYADSRARVIAIIDAIKGKLGAAFPQSNNQPIPGAVMEVVGEPGPGDILAETPLTKRDFALAALAEAEAALGGPDIASQPEAGDLYFAVATSMIASADRKEPETAVFDRVLAQGVDLKSLRDEFGDTLWAPWSEAWETANTISESDVRSLVLERLRSIADKFVDQGVDINDQQGTHTPMVQAAIGDVPGALAELKSRGADINGFDRSGITPLLAAAFHGSEMAAKYLLENGARIDVVSREPADIGGPTPEDEFFAEQEAETCEPSSTPIQCAEQGKAMVLDDPERLREYESIISMLWERQN
jgi:N-acetylmuramoyl-L-alanine amidase/uncharacterized FlgJ-related protein